VKPELDAKEAKAVAKVIMDFLQGKGDWTWKRWLAVLVPLAVGVALALLHSGCTGLEQKPTRGAAQQTGAGTPAQSGSGPATGLGSAQQQADTAAPAQSAAGAGSTQVSEQETVAPKQSGIGLNNQFVFNILTGTTGGFVVVVALILFLSAQKRVPAKLARKVGTLLSKAVEADPAAAGVRSAIGDLARKEGVTEADIQRFRELVGTAPARRK